MNNSTSGLTRDCDLSSGCYKTLHCNGTHIVVHFGGSFAHACMRVRSWLSLCMSVPVSLCPFCHPSSSRLSHLFRRQLSVRVWLCTIVSFLLLLVICFGRPLFQNFGCTRVWARVRVCVRFAIARHRDSAISLTSSARVGACECIRVRVHVCRFPHSFWYH